MALPTYYSTGTASVANAGTAVTGSGTSWLNVLQPGDLFGTHKGLPIRIASVNSNTSLTLAHIWPGTTQSGEAYEIQLTPRSVGVQEATRQLLEQLANGNLSAIAGLTTAADKVAYYTGAGVAALATLTAHARALLELSGGAGKFIRSTGTSTAVMQNIVGTVSQSSGTPTGAIVERGSNSNGEYARFADGTQICTSPAFTGDISLSSGSVYRASSASDGFAQWTFPAPFVGSPSVSPSGQNNSASHWISVRTISATQAALNMWAPASSTSRNASAIAVGRWF
ncbi:hypothetical protein HGO38_01565 [Rhizobium sp. CG5]|uniref:hypothetical protein n=1 Tax=Rhizobium sp. CG5 TaxID=2726076 RepID=UPI0020338CA3|nr:hypothetical protein [Rhizobium sp. CG5]MCM2472164.1 hypothetical protein [Rhizobium sp. CG5]